TRLPTPRGGGKSWDESSSSSPGRMAREAVGVSAVITNVILLLHRSGYSPKAFLLHRTKEVVWKFPSAQTASCFRSYIEAALGRKTRFLRRVVKRANDEVSA